MNAPANSPSLSERLKGVAVSMRGELDISRHLFRSGPAYVVRDPVTFATHRFDPGDYRILNAIDRERTLGDTFEVLVTQGVLTVAEEEEYYAFILALHQRNLLSLPVSDGDALFKRFERRQRAEQLSKLLGVFFLRVPLINPDRLLNRTIPLFGWLFTLPALFLWVLLAGVSLFIAAARWEDLSAPVLTVFDGGNAYMLWATLIGLKVIHEFGHAYACKAYGGHVPEMGAFFILFTPLAYMDATDSWRFTKTRHRAIVTLGGVYFESIIGALALIIWALTEPSTLNTLAYQVVLLATVTTALFNLNPLLRYDAYYLVSDLAGVPNLRARCQEAVASILKKTLFGIKVDTAGYDLEHHPGLVTFGLAQMGYKVVIYMTISTVLIMKFASLGIVLAGFLVSMSLGKALITLFRYVLGAEEARGHRLRAATVSFSGIIAIVTGLLAIPAPWPIEVTGVAAFEHVETLHAPNNGVIEAFDAKIGDVIIAGSQIVLLRNQNLAHEHETMRAQIAVGEAQILNAAHTSHIEAMLKEASQDGLAANIERLESDIRLLRVLAPTGVHVLNDFGLNEGSRVRIGEPLVRIASGRVEAVFLLHTSQYESLKLTIGDTVVCRSPSNPDTPYEGTVSSISEHGSRMLDDRVRDAVRAMSIPVNPESGMAAEPYFEIRLSIDDTAALPANSTLKARFPSSPQTTARLIERRFTRFMNRVNEGFSSK